MTNPVSSIQPTPKRPPFSCAKCSNRWSGLSVCHCGGCHATFGGLALFDRHRANGGCADPARIRNRAGELVMFLRGGVWRGPEMDEDAKARRFGGVQERSE